MSDRDDKEREIREAFDAGDMERAATGVLVAYGRELFGFMTSRLHGASDADEVFSIFTEHLWTGLPGFGWRCSMRTWCYALARNTLRQYVAAPHRRTERNIPISSPGVLSQLVADVRTATRAHQQSEVKDDFRRLRERLDDADQLLLLLRVDRKLSFHEIAITVVGDADGDPAVVTREAARLRQAFVRLKGNLRRLAEDEGLLDPRD